jgi:hypothetical protein
LGFIGAVFAVQRAITHLTHLNAQAVFAAESHAWGGAQCAVLLLGAFRFVAAVFAVSVAVTQGGELDVFPTGAVEKSRDFWGTADFVSTVFAVRVTIANLSKSDAGAIVARKRLFGSGNAAEFIRSVCAVLGAITKGREAQACAVLAVKR